jgi:NAD(P)-dependent dehydrogenase (short-subunit alcohol dehydrogenase family)
MGLMRTLRKMIYQRDGTRINAVCPGITDTKQVTPIASISGALPDSSKPGVMIERHLNLSP